MLPLVSFSLKMGQRNLDSAFKTHLNQKSKYTDFCRYL
uniref:Uncharacterized protein n=1 Tax=Anguilla anguilla TaxID=7936 RepID=A0A0E9T6Z4_ANGAN